MHLTDEQKNVITEILKFKKPVQSLGGRAGSGKSVVVAHLIKALPNWAVVAYTGKAADVLRKKGVATASTIHSLIYVLDKDESGRPKRDKNGSPVFVLNPAIGVDGVIVDEASMVGTEIYKDLCSFGIPIIFVGDHGQLEPIGESMNLMAQPDFVLEKIHRNAGEIAHFADWVRRGYRPGSFPGREKVKFLTKWDAANHFLNADQIICAYNKTRVGVNEKVRTQLGMPPEKPEAWDRVICLRNDRMRGLFNGMQGVVAKLPGGNRMHFRHDGFDHEVRFDPHQFGMEKYDFSGDRNDPVPFDYAYCITCHRYQGSESPRVMVLEQRFGSKDSTRWRYTAASRAKDLVLWVENF